MATRNARSEQSDYAIEFRDVSRRFVLHHERRASFQDLFISFIRPRGTSEEFWALRNVTFGIRRGETLGLVGRNGAGKSTLLKLVTRILEPTEGEVLVNGRTYAMLELGAGFHPELSGRDNIFLNGSLYGFGRKEMQQRYNDIVRFSELERFVDTPVKHYSSGMYARLGFGIAVHMDPEILVIDEVLAVGDATFQQKCYAALETLKQRGTTILFVSHDGDAVRNFCDRAALIVGGHLEDIGPANAVVDHYERLLLEETPRARLLRVRALDRERQSIDTIQTGSNLHVEVLLRVPPGAATLGLALDIELLDEQGRPLYRRRGALPAELPVAPNAGQRAQDQPDARIAELVIERVPLAAGGMHLVSTLLEGNGEGAVIDRQETLIMIEASDPQRQALLTLDSNWGWDLTPPPPPTPPTT